MILPVDKLSQYIIWSFLKSALFIVLVLTGLLLLFDILANADDIVDQNSEILKPLFYYMGLRLPDILVLVLPLSALLASLLTIVQKVSSHEIVIMRASGIPSYRITTMLLGGGLILCVLQFGLMNGVQTHTARALEDWSNKDYRMKLLPSDEEQAIDWVVAGTNLLQVGSSSLDGRLLNDIKIINRDEAGKLRTYMEAVQAVFRDGQWTLFDVYQPALAGSQEASISELPFDLGIYPGFFSKLADRSVEWTLWDLWQNLKTRDVQDRPDYVYELWLHRKFAAPLSGLVMVLLAMPVAIRLARRTALGQSVFLTILAGFSFFILERLLETIGENGELPVLIAAWSPLILFSLLSTWLLLLKEG